MSLLMDLRPNRWIRSCLADGSAFDYCGALGMGDFMPRSWGIDASDNNALLILKVIPDPNGLIASIDTFPNATLYSPSGASGSILSMTSSTTAFGTTTYNYTPLTDTGAGRDIIGNWSVQILGMQVTLKTGDVCTVNFNQSFNGGLPAIAYTLSTTKQSGFSIFQVGGSGYIDWGDSSALEYFDATGAGATTSHTYATPFTYNVSAYCSPGEVTRIQATNQGLTGTADLSRLTALTRLELNSNSALAQVINPVSSATWIAYDLRSCGLTGTLDVSGLSGLGGSFRVEINSGLTQVLFPTSSTLFTYLDVSQCNITGTLNLSGLSNLSGVINFRSNPLLTQVSHHAGPHTGSVTIYQGFSCNITGTLNLSMFNNINSFLSMQSNPNLTGLTVGSWSNTFTSFSLNNCNITGTLNLSTVTGLAGAVNLQSNPLMTAVTMPTTANVITTLRLDNCNITGTLNLSTLTGLGGIINLDNNALMTAITWPTSSQATTQIEIDDSGLTGTMNISGMTGIAGVVNIHNNAALTAITWPASSGTITDLNLFSNNLGYTNITTLTFASTADVSVLNNGMTAAEVNQIAVNLNATLPGAGTGIITLGGIGDTNAALDTTSGGFNGDAAKTSMTGNGYTVNSTP